MAIKLGGVSTSQINEVVYFNDDADIITLDDGRVYLKGGVYETNPSTYPNAFESIAYLGPSFPVQSQDINPLGITWDGTHFWVIGANTDTAYKYTAAGVYTGTSFSVTAQEATPQGITWDGTYFWVVGNTGGVYKYDSLGYQGVSFSVATEIVNPVDITWDGTHFWVVSATEPAGVYKYNSSGVYQNVSFRVDEETQNPSGIIWDGTDFWVTARSGYDAVYKYNASGVYQNVSFSVQAKDSDPQGITWDGTYFWVLGGVFDRVYKYGKAIGIDPQTPLVKSIDGQNYVRVA